MDVTVSLDSLHANAEIIKRLEEERDELSQCLDNMTANRDGWQCIANRMEDQRNQLREALAYAVDNSEFNSEEFDAIARAALKATEE